MSLRCRDAATAVDGLARTGVRGARRHAAFLLALFSFVWLSFVAETHHHRTAAALDTTRLSALGTSHPSSPEQPYDCPICDEIAQCSVYLLPTLFMFVVAALASIWIAPRVPTISAVRTRSHTWLSRAPPLLLHA